MPIKAVQQFMLGTVLSNEQQARETLAAMKAAGYDGIELCGFMIHPIGFVVKLLTKAAGMPVGKRRQSGLAQAGAGGRPSGGQPAHRPWFSGTGCPRSGRGSQELRHTVCGHHRDVPV
ncbi:MAG: hypothetical protein ACLVJH_02450 [Faecalibacterium prausnitzii]